MFIRILKIVGVEFGIVVTLGLLYFVRFYFSIQARNNEQEGINKQILPVNYDSTSYELGVGLRVKDCMDCQGEDFTW